MSTAKLKSGLPYNTQQKYRDNFARHIMGVTLYLQSEIMNAMTLKHGHSQLRINFEPYIAIAGNKGARLSAIAEILGISRQAANQAANQIEEAGYLARTPDPSDGRAKLLTPTPRARALIKQGSLEANRLQQQTEHVVGAAELFQATTSIGRLVRSLDLLLPFEEIEAPPLAGLLPRLSNYIAYRLLTLTKARGHPGLKRSFSSVLTAIGPNGGRIQQMANSQDVSKQAISATASELEALDYIERRPDPKDARQVILVFTARGEQLITDSIAAVDELEQEFNDHLGEEAVQQIKTVMSRIYKSLGLEQDVFGNADSDDIRVLARELTRKLGDEGAKALARLILSGETDK
jgi:DNA-binding MarR family transcriptional regulator